MSDPWALRRRGLCPWWPEQSLNELRGRNPSNDAGQRGLAHLTQPGCIVRIARVNTDAQLHALAQRLAQVLMERRRMLVTAESCTGGWTGKVLTDVAGSSRWYLGGAIAYSNAFKQSLLGVAAATLATHGAVSEATAREMAHGALARLGGDLAIAVTGIAGPDGGQPDKPVGTVWFAWAWQQAQQVHTHAGVECFDGDREAVRRQSVVHALEQALAISVRSW
jgi:nicotinamide-nucleotide amidase